MLKPPPKYFDEIDEVIGLDHDVRAAVTIDSSNPNPKKRSSPEEEDSADQNKKQKVSNKSSQSKTKSSKLVETLIDHLNESKKRRKKLEKELKRQHQEKMALLRQFMGLPPQEVPVIEDSSENDQGSSSESESE